jgi:hypothetical protein
MLKSIALLLGDLRISFEKINDLWLPSARIVFPITRLLFGAILAGLTRRANEDTQF